MRASLGGRYADVVNAAPAGPLWGFVDLHTHPASHLGFGGRVVYGAPDGDPSHALADCGFTHGGFDAFSNPHGDAIRAQIVSQLGEHYRPAGWRDDRHGWPGFTGWPTWHDCAHQQSRIEWLRRAWAGGLRAIVALAVNNQTLANSVNPTPQDSIGAAVENIRGNVQVDLSNPLTPPGAGSPGRLYWDDQTTAEVQLQALTAMASASDFMVLVEKPADFRAAVAADKLAVILGVEIDGIGNFYSPHNVANAGRPYNPDPTDQQIRDYVDRLWDLGARYFFPVHVTDNIFGGAALYNDQFDVANRYMTGHHFVAEPAPASSAIGYVFKQADPLVLAAALAQLRMEAFVDWRTPPVTTTGHRNSRGLTRRGDLMVRYLMSKGALIDIDHMGERTAGGVLAIAEAVRYPVMAGHCGFRPPGTGSERLHQTTTIDRIYALNGMMGVGLAQGAQPAFDTLAVLGSASPPRAGGFGSDASGLEALARPVYPAPAPIDAPTRSTKNLLVYRGQSGASPDALEPCQFGQRTWDYAVDGMAHIGLYPDLIEQGHIAGTLGDQVLRNLFSSAEQLARAWESCYGVDPTARWTLLAPSGTRQVVTDGDTIYRLATDGTIWQFTGVPGPTGWRRFGGSSATRSIAASTNGVFRREANGVILQYNGQPSLPWVVIDNNPRCVDITAGGGRLYQLHDTGIAWRYTGPPITGWQPLSDPAPVRQMITSGGRLLLLHQDGSIVLNENTDQTTWVTIDQNPRGVEIAAAESFITQRHDTGAVWRYAGPPITGWPYLDGTADNVQIAAGDDFTVYVRRAGDGSIWALAPTPGATWTCLDANPSTTSIVVLGSTLYQLHDDGSLWRFVATPTT